MHLRLPRQVLVCVALSLAACGPSEGGLDASFDAPLVDVAEQDVGADEDAGPSQDAGGEDAFMRDARASDSGGACFEVSCAISEVCQNGSCACADGFEPQGEGCIETPTAPETHTSAQVCERFLLSNVESAETFIAGPGGMCDPGRLTDAAVEEGVRRTNFYRWLSGLYSIESDDALGEGAQACAVIQAYSPVLRQSGFDPHLLVPRDNFQCVTELGADGAAHSNITYGPLSARAMTDGFIFDRGNDFGLGHRRLILAPDLERIGIGLYHGGPNNGVSQFGGGVCMDVLSGRAAEAATPALVAYPPPGPMPLSLMFHADDRVPALPWSARAPGLTPSTSVEITRVSDGAVLGTSALGLRADLSPDTTAWRPQGWSPVAGESYDVTLRSDAIRDGLIGYRVQPVACE